MYTSHFFQGNRKTRPCLTGRPLVELFEQGYSPLVTSDPRDLGKNTGVYKVPYSPPWRKFHLGCQCQVGKNVKWGKGDRNFWEENQVVLNFINP